MLPSSRREAGRAVARRREVVGVLSLEGKFRRDRQEEAQQVYRTTEEQHPGVANLYQEGDVLLGGKITMFPGRPSLEDGIAAHYRTPSQTREGHIRAGMEHRGGLSDPQPRAPRP